MLLWMGLFFGAIFVVFLFLAIRRATIGHSGLGDRIRSRKTEPPIDAWTEAGRRLQIQPHRRRLDDTIDLDPFGPDEDNW